MLHYLQKNKLIETLIQVNNIPQRLKYLKSDNPSSFGRVKRETQLEIIKRNSMARIKDLI